jgi:hypothetical protein
MLTIFGEKQNGFCDGISRRSFLKIGGLVMGGMALSDILRAQTQSGVRNSHKAIIMVYLAGGPSHLDLFDMKPEAPSEIRGELKPMKTNVPGIEICEVLPRLAKQMDKCAIIRSMTGARDEHSPAINYNGFNSFDNQLKKHPAVGSVVSYLQGPVDKAVPPYVGLSGKTQHSPWAWAGDPGFLGLSYGPVRPFHDGMADLALNGISLSRLQDRKKTLASLDNFRRHVDSSTEIQGMDDAAQRAFSILTSKKFVNAFDISKEPQRVRERYGDGKPYNYQYDGAPTANDHFLIARRLVEAGVRVVTLSFGRWDSHGDNFKFIRDHGGKLDQALSALIEDLDQRGLLNDVSIVVWGEFGRTPRINSSAGRDHWPQANFALLAGGGMRTGQVIGSTNRFGEFPEDRPVHYRDVLTTLYHCIGIDMDSAQIPDATGRPRYIFDREHEPVKELI